MILPELPALARSRKTRQFAASILLLLLVVVAPAEAAEDEAFAATVKLDATADSAAKAREQARLDGQRRALIEVAGRLNSAGGTPKLPKLDDNTITNLVASFEVANERMSPVRYMADYTFHFRPAETRRALRLPETAGAAAGDAGTPSAAPGKAGEGSLKPAERAARPAVVLPVYQTGARAVLWEDPNPWRSAWAQRPVGDGAARLSVPLGDSADLVAIDADKARAGDAEALAAITKQNGGDDAIVAVAAARGSRDQPSGLDIMLKHYRGGQLVDSRSATVSANPGEMPDEFFLRAAETAAGTIESAGIREMPGKIDQQGSLVAAIPITSLDDWLQLRDRLTGVSTIRKVELMALSRQEATVELQYSGSVDQLKASLADLDLDLVRGDAASDRAWRLARSAASGRR